uniref:J domain-containing protein n=1 Tax=Meloidogyne enterolobii TaxID=390850 RepID=A0A6V7WBZ3_MELEN|nr:unnamed protein product [Meloidogyne enterolobii]
MNLNEALILMGLTAPLDQQTLNKMHRKLALKYHLDRNSSCPEANKMMQNINTAKNIIEQVSN